MARTVSLIVGGSSGIGASVINKLCLHDDMTIYNLDTQPKEPVTNQTIIGNVSELSDCEEAVKKILSEVTNIDNVFINAGVHLQGNIETTDLDQAKFLFDINFFGTVNILKAVLPIMKKQQRGNIVLMGSDQTFVAKPYQAIYGASKAAVAHLAKSTALDYAKHNIRVNCVCPGTIDTPFAENAISLLAENNNMDRAELLNAVEKAQPIRRLGTPDEVASLVCFLLSDESSYMTGACIPVDGGYTAQ